MDVADILGCDAPDEPEKPTIDVKDARAVFDALEEWQKRVHLIVELAEAYTWESAYTEDFDDWTDAIALWCELNTHIDPTPFRRLRDLLWERQPAQRCRVISLTPWRDVQAALSSAMKTYERLHPVLYAVAYGPLSDGDAELTAREQTVVEAVRELVDAGKVATQEHVAEKAGYRLTGEFKGMLSALVKRKVLLSRQPGYKVRH